MSGELCGVDSGYTTLATSTTATAGTATDGTVAHHRVYVSVTRDGSVWLRLGRDQAASQEVRTCAAPGRIAGGLDVRRRTTRSFSHHPTHRQRHTTTTGIRMDLQSQ